MATVRKRGNAYAIRVSNGYDINGKQIVHTMTWTVPEGLSEKQEVKELERQKVLFEEKVKTGQTVTSGIRLAEFAELWVKDYVEKQLRPTTAASYKQALTRILPALGHLRLDRIQPHHLITFYSNLEESGLRKSDKMRCTGDIETLMRSLTNVELSERSGVSISAIQKLYKGGNISKANAEAISKALGQKRSALFIDVSDITPLSPATIRKHHVVLSSLFATAVEWQVIAYNPCDRVKPPKLEKQEAQYLDEYQTAELLELLYQEDIMHRTMIMLFIFTGMRRGELCGLEWSDIDMKNRVVHILRSSLYLPDRGIFEDFTKNESSQRAVKIPVSMVELLREYRAWQTETRLSLGDKRVDSGKVFTKWNGAPIFPDSVTAWFRKFIERSNLPEITIHSLRHTSATLQIAGGVPVTAVADRLGHANPATTNRVYAHAIKSANAAAADILEDMLNPQQKQKRA